MRRLIPLFTILAAALLFATMASAQAASVSGTIIAPDGAPWVDIEVTMQNTNTGQKYDTRTNNKGQYTQLGMAPGIYKFTFFDKRSNGFTYSEVHQIQSQQDNDVSIDFKKLIASAGGAYTSKEDAQKKKATDLKSHFDAGVNAMNDSNVARQLLASTPTAQKGPVQDRLDGDYKTAIGEFQQAQQLDSPTDVANQSTIWYNLGVAYDYSGKPDQAVDAYQKAIAVKPQPMYYQKLSLAQTNLALAQSDPAQSQQKLADAGATCDKAAPLDPGTAARCWKNIGITLSNKGDMKDAIAPLQKTTGLDPKDAQAWFLLGSALVATADTKQEGNEMVTTFPPGTEDAFHKCMEADPNGPYASQAKDILDSVATMTAGEKTSVGSKKK